MSLFPIQFFVHTLLTNKQCNVQVYNDGSLTCKDCLIQLCRVICRVLFWHDHWGEKIFYSLHHRLRLLMFFFFKVKEQLRSAEVPTHAQKQNAEGGADD